MRSLFLLSALIPAVLFTACTPADTNNDTGNTAGSSASSSTEQRYSNDEFNFSIDYPNGWKTEIFSPGGRTAEVYAANAYAGFYPEERAAHRNEQADPYRIVLGYDLQVYKDDSVESFLNHRDAEWPPNGGRTNMEEITIAGFEGVAYDTTLSDMLGKQSIYTIVLRVGNDVFELRSDLAEKRLLKQYAETIRVLQ